ncbi:hypothetical protein CpipJ_CPIJ007382 [Culex quinquefasciatus]|uniref:Uncharacterized protein n=1 Tax=Culex quinquefasciatus TaxID=7176 RepID=B0WJE6_CULQU|nr:hypothetical protein CpipJ_CPIJ007382 [Culex quinquefasciatus]|eukprot:XP_001848830.1 hypothetical protein CpipJ_CPIJ007382 [Culex quinquefasciatus]
MDLTGTQWTPTSSQSSDPTLGYKKLVKRSRTSVFDWERGASCNVSYSRVGSLDWLEVGVHCVPVRSMLTGRPH